MFVHTCNLLSCAPAWGFVTDHSQFAVSAAAGSGLRARQLAIKQGSSVKYTDDCNVSLLLFEVAFVGTYLGEVSAAVSKETSVSTS